MKKFLHIFLITLLYIARGFTQNPYPIIPIDTLQFVSQNKLTTTPINDTSDYINPNLRNSTFADTVRFNGIVVTNPKTYGLSVNRKAAYIQREGGGPWSGVLVMCDPSTVPVATRPTLNNFIIETKFYENVVKGYKVRATGKFGAFQGETQINLLRNAATFSNEVMVVDSNIYQPVYSLITVDSLMTGSPSANNWLQNKATGEKWEGVLVELRNVRVTSRAPLGGTRWNWSLQDTFGNQIDVRDFSAYYRNDDNESVQPPIANNFTPPPVGTTLGYIRGIVTEYLIGGVLRYGIAPIMPEDVNVCESPCSGLSIYTPSCAFTNNPMVFNISQYKSFSTDNGILEFSSDSNFTNIIKYDTFSISNSNSTSLTIFHNLNIGNYFVRLRLLNQNVISNHTKFNLSTNQIFVSDTVIAFKKDSLLLDAGSGFVKYTWTTVDTTQTLWVKNNGVYQVTTKNNFGCSVTDSIRVIFIDGIQQNDTTICAGSSINLSVPASVPSNGLVGWWPFNGNANDESGKQNSGVINGATLTTDRFGNPNSAYYFDGINDKISSQLNNPLLSNWSVSFWFNSFNVFNNFQGQNVMGLFSDSSQWGGPGFQIFGQIPYQQCTQSNRLNKMFFFDATMECGGGFLGNSTYSNNTWYKVVIVKNNLNYDLIINNQLVASNVLTDIDINKLTLGNRDGLNFQFFKGKIDDIAIWNRPLSTDEILNLNDVNIVKTKCNWSTNDTTSSIKLSPTTSTTYYCDINIGGYTFRDSVRVNVNTVPNINLPDTTIAFKSDSIQLNIGSGFSTYLWSNGDTTNTIWVKSNDNYKVLAQNNFGCSASDSTRVLFVEGIQQNATVICYGDTFNISVENKIPTNGLVAWYPFNGNIKDESYLANGSINYGSVLTNDRFNNSNSAILTTDGYILSSNVGLPVNDTFSISFWYNHISDFDIGEVINLGSQSNTSWGALASTNKFCINYGRGCGSTGSTGAQGVSNNNTWNHILYVSYGRNRLSKVYLNGVFIGNATNANSSGFCSNAQLAIGRDRFANANFNGKLDDIAIWNRALTQQEIQQTYSFGNNSYSSIHWSTNDTTNSITVSPTTSTTYYCDITVGSYKLRDSVRVNVRELPNKSINYTKLGLCKNDSITLNAASGYNYSWLKNDTIVGQAPALNVSQMGAYRVALIDSFGCRNTSDTIHVFNAPIPQANILINDTAQCLKENMFVFKDSTLLDSGTYNRIWSFGTRNTSTQIEPTYNYTNTGSYSVKLSVTTNYGCKDSVVKVVTVNANPTAGPMLGETNALTVATPYNYTVAQQPNHTYNWVANNGIIAAGQGTNAATVQWLANGKGSLKVEVTNSQGCSDTTFTQVTIGNVGLYEAGNINSLMVYPNPSNGAFTVSLNAIKSSTVQMSLINLLGQEIWSDDVMIKSGEQNISVQANLSRGMYTLRLAGQDDQIQQKVIIK